MPDQPREFNEVKLKFAPPVVLNVVDAFGVPAAEYQFELSALNWIVTLEFPSVEVARDKL